MQPTQVLNPDHPDARKVHLVMVGAVTAAIIWSTLICCLPEKPSPIEESSVTGVRELGPQSLPMMSQAP